MAALWLHLYCQWPYWGLLFRLQYHQVTMALIFFPDGYASEEPSSSITRHGHMPSDMDLSRSRYPLRWTCTGPRPFLMLPLITRQWHLLVKWTML